MQPLQPQPRKGPNRRVIQSSSPSRQHKPPAPVIPRHHPDSLTNGHPCEVLDPHDPDGISNGSLPRRPMPKRVMHRLKQKSSHPIDRKHPDIRMPAQCDIPPKHAIASTRKPDLSRDPHHRVGQATLPPPQGPKPWSLHRTQHPTQRDARWSPLRVAGGGAGGSAGAQKRDGEGSPRRQDPPLSVR